MAGLNPANGRSTIMFLEAIYHSTYSEYSYALSENEVVLRLRAKKGDLTECSVFVGDRMCPHNPIHTSNYAMKKVASDRFFDYFETTFVTPYTRICYYFVISDGKETLYYYDNDFHTTLNPDRQMYFTFHHIRREDIARVPQWAKVSTIYQIFPDSFATSRRYISQKAKKVTLGNGIQSNSINGGTLKGVTENLDYLADLGIDCIYMTPIFASNSWHKYDTIDYYTIDPCLGSNEDFKELVQKAHEKGIRVILDAVFNHSGPDFFAFRDIIEKGEASAYKDWYYNIYKYPVTVEPNPGYECFAYVETMPKLNTGHPEVMKYFIDVAVHWIKEYDIDGWRFDVANEVNFEFWRELRKAVKAVKPDVFLIGEIWDDAKPWVQGEQFDSLMNYNFKYACVDFFAKRRISVAQFDAKIQSLLMRYRKPIQESLMNLIDSHDVPRFVTEAGGDLRRLKIAALFHLMHVGIPSIYYGDEKGFSGLTEAEYRRPMLWKDDETSMNMFNYYKDLIKIRKNNLKALSGSYTTLLTDTPKELYVFKRGEGKDALIIAINNGENECTAHLPIDSDAKIAEDILNKKSCEIVDGKLIINLKGVSGAIYSLK
jgi:glycosidase